MDPNLGKLLQWGIKNSGTEGENGETEAPARQVSTLDPKLLNALLGGPSDADLMKEAMGAIRSDDAQNTLENRLLAFDNFEQLIENLDNANNIGPLGLWTPLLACLDDPEPEIRKYAAWCIGTAVQNNQSSQERCLAMGGIERLVQLATRDTEPGDVRKKAVYALSSVARNYQAGMNVLTKTLGELPGREAQGASIDAANMEACDGLIDQLRTEALAAQT